MKCPVCGSPKMYHGCIDIPYAFRGHKTIIHNVSGNHCSHCGESVMDKSESAVFMDQVKHFRAHVIAQTVEPGYIAKVRKKLALTQREASEIFGGGVNAFSRYEKGKSQPHPSTIKLLQVLDNHPELLQEIR